MYKKGGSTPIQYVKGVGPKMAVLLKRKEIETVEDAFYFLPRTYEDRSKLLTISELKPLEYGLFKAEILDVDLIPLKKSRRKILSVKVGDKTGNVYCKWFNFNERYMLNFLKPGAKVFVSGLVSIYSGRVEIHHPDIEVAGEGNDTEDKIHYGRIVPIYSETEGFGQKTIRRIMFNLVEAFTSGIEDFMPLEVIERLNLPDLKNSFRETHFPSSSQNIEYLKDFRTNWQKRLVFDEFFIFELALALRRKGIKKRKGISFDIKPDYIKTLDSKMPFSLTAAQKKVISEIINDMKKDEPMNRLIQGDVGSGKTIVAFYCALIAMMNGYQSALMAPTEILAEQHHKSFKKIFGDDFESCLLVSSINKAEKLKMKKDIESGKIKFVIGTHAIIQEDVAFKNLAFVIVDEQHRFGVEQRLHLINKGNPDILVMTATPIPRTLSMTLYGDLDISIIDQKPAGRIPIITKLVYENKRKVVYDFVRTELEKGRQAYFVYPLIEESEKIMLKNAKDSAKHLSEYFKEYRVGLLHGKMRQEEKDAVMKDFKDCKIHLLVSTTVVEVGIDVPNATIMFIEHPERFGLSQLHQLRGRIGRGESRSVCIMMVDTHLTEVAQKRLGIMVATDDGFKIAEEDLAIRGPGEFLGTRQHGIPGFRVGNLLRDIDTLVIARNEAQRVVDNDPDLVNTVNKKLKEVMAARFKDKMEMIYS
ncbi:MAG: ATP-dependent DNA helicase RecG [bacterium]